MSRLPGFIILALVIALVVRISFVYYIVYVLAGVYVVSHIWIRRAVSNVTVSRKLDQRVFQGESSALSLEVVNEGWLPVPWLRLRELLPPLLAFPPSETWSFALMPKSRVTVHYSVIGRRRGFYTIGPLLGSAGDVFGVEEVRYRAEDVVNLTVYPKVKHIAELGLPSRSPFGDLRSRQRIYEDPARVGGVRDYVTGDSLRRVNWKVSAKAAKLQVKKYDPAISQELAIFLDMTDASYDPRNLDYASELAVVTAASVAAHMLEARQSVALNCNGSLALHGGDRVDATGTNLAIPSGRGHGHLMEILTGLARVELTGRVDFPDLLRRGGQILPWGSTVVVVSGHDSPEMVNAMLQLRRAGFNVVAIIVQRPSARRRRLAEAVASQAYRIWIEEDLGGFKSVA